MRRMALVLMAAAVMATAAPIQAQGPVAGRWITEYYRVVGGHGGGGESELARARLTLTARGDSVIGTWEDLVAEGTPTPRPRGLRGVARGGTIELTADPVQAIMRQHLGGEQRVLMIATYQVSVRGDSLVGTVRTQSDDGRITNNPRRFSAVRETP